MGSCVSSPSGEAQSKKIDLALKADERRRKLEVKLLLLGAGEAGKTTVIKQMKLLHASGFSIPEREVFRAFIFSNLVGSMQSILSAMDDHGIPLSNPDNERYLPVFATNPRVANGTPFPPQYQPALKALWMDGAIQKAYRLGHTYALADNSTGITETTFHIGSLTYRMFDVGGQRSERKKWIHCFEGVTAVLFMAAISGYDQCLVEDKDAVCNSQWFTDTSIILFLNKTDIFREKLHYSRVKDYFPDYEGPDTGVEEATEFFRKRFIRLNRSEHKEVYVHYSDATDTDQLRNVMNSVNDIILGRNVRSALAL
ncbi:hypothetical protein KI688_006147 [Linnemannia hyalina]|uniref:Guanine nucleotide-binding protein alpha-2 subunit n=1 Tax=Linnemannia hyalina TaxID=64524 RepID=A0A9P7Y435_9FUNG|nr:hypothetical protein KI688_006147 [Linnemannia hyalina]